MQLRPYNVNFFSAQDNIHIVEEEESLKKSTVRKFRTVQIEVALNVVWKK